MSGGRFLLFHQSCIQQSGSIYTFLLQLLIIYYICRVNFPQKIASYSLLKSLIVHVFRDSKVPVPPAGHKWKRVQHDNQVSTGLSKQTHKKILSEVYVTKDRQLSSLFCKHYF